jgi:flagellum-specific ATP synthase
MRAEDEISPAVRIWGRVAQCDGTVVRLAGLGGLARIGDGVLIEAGDQRKILGEVIALDTESVTAMLMAPPQGLMAGQRAYLAPDCPPCPCDGWLGLVIDAFGRVADGRPAPQGDSPAMLRRAPPRGERRRSLGPRLATGQSALDTMLPLCRGQRLGIFAGSGVGKSMLMAGLARGVDADVVVT